MSDINMNELYRSIANAFINRECEVEGVIECIRYLINPDELNLSDEELLALHFNEEDIEIARDEG